MNDPMNPPDYEKEALPVAEVMEEPGVLADYDNATALEQENIPNPRDESRNP